MLMFVAVNIPDVWMQHSLKRIRASIYAYRPSDIFALNWVINRHLPVNLKGSVAVPPCD